MICRGGGIARLLQFMGRSGSLCLCFGFHSAFVFLFCSLSRCGWLFSEITTYSFPMLGHNITGVNYMYSRNVLIVLVSVMFEAFVPDGSYTRSFFRCSHQSRFRSILLLLFPSFSVFNCSLPPPMSVAAVM